MKAPVFKGVGQPLAIETVPDPTPAAGELVLKVARCGICGTDLHMTDGHGDTYTPGSVIGHEFAGEVVAVGPDVVGFRTGDCVAALPVVGCGRCWSCLAGETAWCDSGTFGIMGGAAQYAIARAHAAIKLPKTLSLADGALIEPLATSLHGVTLAELKPGARVLIQGAGPIGIGCVFWAKRLGAGRIAITARSRRCEGIAMHVGASVFLPSSQNLADEVNAALRGPPDVVFECVGAPGQLAQAVGLVRRRGTVVLLGMCMLQDNLVPSAAMLKQVRIQGSMVYSVREFETVADVLDSGETEPQSMITNTVSLDELPSAFEALRVPTTQCKVMVSPHV